MAVIKERVGDVLVVKLSRPEKRNAFNLDMARRVLEALDEGCAAGGVVITGSGGFFSSGLDLAEIYGLRSLESSLEFFGTVNRVSKRIVECPKPVVAFVNGPALGYGTEMLYFVDYAVAVKSAYFSLPGVRYGLMTATPVVAPLLLGPRARSFLDWEFKLTAEEALEWGLVQRLVDDERQGMEVAVNIVKKIGEVPNASAIKRHFKAVLKLVEKDWAEFEKLVAEAAVNREVKSKIELFLKR
ncbi:enoyl-CoA hydratase [Thermoproteus uzoniensis 768-20]|uniref:Enoyl-CoA hydratase n=1 Tax=Thermoproteus uzoniensis (strain 768-20) TaxID=999630 RepID=F2L5F7_THEU7|nr:enoyl-CoA hydratase/isomerase family protein [Thermoproteus uzoniensis]AEA12328.1 enoyl-CoA hydratase [Thermoproteus uzoniensis 768-20]